MKSFFPFTLLIILLLLAMITQDVLPSMPFFGQTHLILVPMIFCFAALALPFPFALLFALVTGVLQGLMVMSFHHGHVEIRLGWFIFFFIIWAVLLQFLSDRTDGVRWELHALGSGLCTASFLFGEFFLLSFSRGHFSITDTVLLLALIPGGIALFIAPLFYAVLQFLLPPAKPLRVSHLSL